MLPQRPQNCGGRSLRPFVPFSFQFSTDSQGLGTGGRQPNLCAASCGPGEVMATTGHKVHEQPKNSTRREISRDPVPESTGVPTGPAPPCATRQSILTWCQGNRFTLPPVSIVANDISLLCAADQRGDRVRQEPQGAPNPHRLASPTARAPAFGWHHPCRHRCC